MNNATQNQTQTVKTQEEVKREEAERRANRVRIASVLHFYGQQSFGTRGNRPRGDY